MQSLVEPVTDAVAATLPELAAPIAAIMSLAQLPANYAALFGISATQSAGGSVVGSAAPSAGGETAAVLQQLIQSPSGTPRTVAPVTVDAPASPPSAASPFDLTAALGQMRSASMGARVVPDDAGTDGVQAFLKSYGGLVAAAVAVAASLAALVAAAFPGLAGIFIPTAAGARIGYRQAKARMAMRTPTIARFSATGPIGIVSSGALVTLRPKSSYVARARAADLVQDVA